MISIEADGAELGLVMFSFNYQNLKFSTNSVSLLKDYCQENGIYIDFEDFINQIEKFLVNNHGSYYVPPLSVDPKRGISSVYEYLQDKQIDIDVKSSLQ